MGFDSDRTASRTGRDRDVFDPASHPGPYEAPYDVRRGYQEPFRARRTRNEPPRMLLMAPNLPAMAP